MASTKSVGTVSPTQYVAWVQRSLNRLLDAALVTDGAITSEYREQMKEFQFAYGLAATGEVHPADQNELIKANHKTPEYVAWAQRALVKVGAGIGLASTGAVNKETTGAIFSFQAYQGLVDDGWIGAKTDTALIRESGTLPPGHLVHGPPPPKPKPKPPVVVDPLPIEKRVDRVIGAVYYELVHNPSVYPNVTQRKQLKCILHKLKTGSGIDDKYIPRHRARSFVLGTDWSFSRGYTPDDLANSAREILRTRISKMVPSERLRQEAIRKVVLHLYYEIELGLTEIARLYSVHGQLPDLEKPDVPLAARTLHKWAYDRRGKSTSILKCFA